MNEIEERFYKALLYEADHDGCELICHHDIVPQVTVGIYKVDFLVDDVFVIEIDGFEFHKTKEQREKDYNRERYLIRQGKTVLRFTGTEIFLSCNDRAKEALKTIDDLCLSKEFTDMESCLAYYEQRTKREAKQNAK